MDWKGPREWAIERDSVRNKKKYAERWGYDLEIADMSTKKRYAHEWRESWEKVDIMRNCMRKYPAAEWYVEALRQLTSNVALKYLQVLVARPQHLCNGAFLLPSVSHFQIPRSNNLPRYQRLQPLEHFPPNDISIPRPAFPLAYR